MTENLKNCPFCGGKATCVEFYGLYHVICCNCHIAGKDCSTRESAVSAWNRRNETELVKQFLINNDKNLIVKFERSEPNARMSFPIGISYNFDNIRDLNDIEKEVLSKILTDAKKELCDDVPYEQVGYSCRACESAHHERENKLEAENKRLREEIAKELERKDCQDD